MIDTVLAVLEPLLVWSLIALIGEYIAMSSNCDFTIAGLNADDELNCVDNGDKD